MVIEVKKEKEIQEVAEFLADLIMSRLQECKQVLWLATGGSSIPVGIAIAQIIKNDPHSNLAVTLTDERYGDIGHADSNWHKLEEGGFDLPQAKLIPVLIGKKMDDTVKKFDSILKKEFESADYKIGLFGIGPDGHTAGILPNSPAVTSDNFAIGYHTDTFNRITMTPKAISMLDEAVVFVQGKGKQEAIENLEKDLPVSIEPAQILKSVPKLTIFINYEE